MPIGYEIIFAIAGGLAIIYLLYRGKAYSRWKTFWKERRKKRIY
jgi:hypothetical protein